MTATTDNQASGTTRRPRKRAKSSAENPTILNAAAEVFLEFGFHGSSVRQVADRAGLTVPSLYYYYENKQGLLRAVLLTALDPIATALEKETEEGTPAEKLVRATRVIADAMTRTSKTAPIDSESRYLTPENAQEYIDIRHRIEDRLKEIIADGVREGQFDVDDISETQRALLGMLQNIPRWYRQEGKNPPEEITRRYEKLALRLVGVRPTDHLPA